jgi:hypothetical protein
MKMAKPMTAAAKRNATKIEVFTANYLIDKDGRGLLGLFDEPL